MTAPTPTKSPEKIEQTMSSKSGARIRIFRNCEKVLCTQIPTEQLISHIKIKIKTDYRKKRCSSSNKFMHKNTDHSKKNNMVKPIAKVKSELCYIRGKIKIQSILLVAFLLNIIFITDSTAARQEGKSYGFSIIIFTRFYIICYMFS